MQLQKYRKNAGMTQEQLAERADMSVSTITSIEAGRRNGSVETIIKLAEILGVTTDDLLRGDDITNSNNFKEVSK